MNNVQSLSQAEKPEIIFLYLNDNIDPNSEEVIYIRDFCVEDDKKLFLVGYKANIEEVQTVIPDEIIAGAFERPIDSKALGEELSKIIEKEEVTSHKKHILVVDDSCTMLRTIRRDL